ncbi:protein phosphatase, Mg2+/Mn2+ dependent, 1Lb isoform X2 [Syngnathoides biaculeatus]|uniref:protein phosphatase, Mg2+/Mn2+ dependent, 1Lb isoform X2 n=1 Tax=Syngnathoides biaculeatus TaxID=300417 RepID=UPI002ADDB9EA|nr:protein phosphatase, Mg2+/Mn2+ dependent, 1Lb isoform X2 [Syngnathoides biaculeatus]
MIEDTMTLLSLLGRIMRYFLLRPETLFLLCISLALWSYFFHTDEVKTIVKSSRDAVKMVKGKVAEMMHNERFGGLDVPDAEFAKTWELKSHNVAVYSIQGRRDHMEDRYDVLADVVNKTHPSIFGIFDGHGGEAAADYAKAHLPEALRQQLLTYERERERDREKDKEKNEKKEGVSYPSILEQQILMLDRAMLEKLSATYNEAGTTCLVALLSDKELTVANVGDSRGVLCDKDGNAIPLSHDHKPYQLKERKRIKKAGGFISFNGSWRVQGILAMSRSLGDYTLKNLNVVIPDPDILSFDLNKLQPEFMILASDGLWDTFSNEEAVRFVRERLDEPHFGAKSIVLQSYYRGCPDNITVMVVKFKGKTAER